MNDQGFKPYVPEDTKHPELTARATILGVAMAGLMAAANAYIGMKAGMTIAATFPAAVISMAVLRLFKGSILEENISRTAASVGEAMIAGAIFTIPAFVIAGVWKDIDYWSSTIILLIGGILGILFVIILRRTLCEDPSLPFPESTAAAEIHKAGQKGQTGAGLVFGAMGLSAAIEFLKNDSGLKVFAENVGGYWEFTKSRIQLLTGDGSPVGDPMSFGGGLLYRTPSASPAYMGIGFIIGPKLSAINFAGGVFAWFFLIPLVMFLNGDGGELARIAQQVGRQQAATAAWSSIVRPLAVGAMIVGAFYTLFGLRGQLMDAVRRGVRDLRGLKGEGEEKIPRLQKDIPFPWIFAAIIVMLIPIFFIYNHYSGNVRGAAVATVVMTLTGFLFSVIAGYLVGVIGSSSSPVSGLTLSTLLVAALLILAVGISGHPGVAATLGVATVVCCATCTSGSMIQDLKVGHYLGGTPWKMQAVEILSTIVVSFILVLPIIALHKADIAAGGSGIGGPNLPAPQAGLMALLSQGIMGGGMAWPLVGVGMAFAVALILIKAPSPMLIAVGMYLPFPTTAAIFVGGAACWIMERVMDGRKLAKEAREAVANRGILVASGLISGEAITGVLLAVMVLLREKLPWLELPKLCESAWASLLIFAVTVAVLIAVPLKGGARKEDCRGNPG